MQYLDTLNESQRQAVLHTEGPCMIIAGAGSGKTRVLTLRIAHLIEKGVSPFNILALTFTNKASAEMRSRMESIIGTDARSVWMGTFHSVFAKILRIESDRIGFPSNFTIYDTDDCKSLIKSILNELQLDDKIYKPGLVLSRISSAKNRLISWQEYNQNALIKADDDSSMKPELGRIYKLYQERMFKADAMDFDDLLFNTNALFRDHIDVLNKYQDKFRYVLVDEFQDTNVCQYSITRKIAARFRNISVVGDDAQSIYAFRGADIQNILNFERDYPELEVFKLEQNYRSTKVIVNAANSIIVNNKAQLKKNVWTANADGDLIEVLSAQSDNEEGRMVANAIFEKKMQHQFHNKDFAILYRTNAQSRAIEEALRKMNINYKIYGGLSFYQRKEIKDLIAYLRITLNSNDEQAFKRVINYPKRGIGDATVARVFVHANEQNLPLWHAVQIADQYLDNRAANGILNFVYLIKNFKLAVQALDAYEAAMQIAKESGILKELYADRSVEGVARYENLQELLNAIKEYVDNPEKEDKSLDGFLQDISLLTDTSTEEADADHVSLMTIHSSKGLEFKNVFIVGLEEELFPSQMMINSREDLEEERRLFYVAVTRAEKSLTFSHASSRYQFGRLKMCEPSRFLKEIDEQYLNIRKRPSLRPEPQEEQRTFTSNYSGNYSNLLQNVRKAAAPSSAAITKKTSSYIPSVDFEPSDTSNLGEGMTVEHPKFGFGVVKELDLRGDNRKAKILFKDHGEKTLLLSFAKLKIHA